MSPARPASHELTGVLATVEYEFGLGVALKLAHEFGGTEVFVPKLERLDKDHAFSKLFGFELAKRLVGELGAGRVLIPMGPTASVAKRAQLIAQENERGVAASAIARRANVHLRTVKRHRRRIRDAVEADDLFTRAKPR